MWTDRLTKHSYLICLTIGPAFLSASIYVCLSRLVVIHGAHLAPLKPRTYTLSFICCDIISLVLQAAGGAIAATANLETDKQTGVNVMIAGLAFQVFSLALFMVLSLDFVRRVHRAGFDEGAPEYYDLRQKPMFKMFPYGASFSIFILTSYYPALCDLVADGPSLYSLSICHFDNLYPLRLPCCRASKWIRRKTRQ